MTPSVIAEPRRPTPGRRASQALDRARRRAGEQLAGRTVWFAAGLPGPADAADSLTGQPDWEAEHAVSRRPLRVTGDEPLARLSALLEAMLTGTGGLPRPFGAAERAIFSDGTRDAETIVGPGVAPEDIVVLHDALAAVTAQAARERGAHVVWRLEAGAGARGGLPTAAWSFLEPFTRAVDAYLASWPAAPRSPAAIVSMVPCCRGVATTDAAGGSAKLGWGGVLADVVGGDRDETVGGTLHARPAVAVR